MQTSIVATLPGICSTDDSEARGREPLGTRPLSCAVVTCTSFGCHDTRQDLETKPAAAASMGLPIALWYFHNYPPA